MPLNGFNELPEMRFEFPYNLIGKSTISYFNRPIMARTQSKDFGAILPDRLNQSLASSVALASQNLVLNLSIGARKTQVFWHSEARTAATVWNWSGKTLSPGALLAVLYFSFVPYFSAHLDFPSPPLSAPGSPRMQ